MDENGKEQRPMVIHRSSIGCIERTIAYLLEKTQGRLPTWLSPVQAKVISFTERNEKAARKLAEQLKELNIRTELDIENGPIQGRVRDAELQKIPYIIMIGDKEEKAKTLAVRNDGKVKFGVKTESFVKDLKKEIEEKK
jgi:threonyl-tRNA synthetase